MRPLHCATLIVIVTLIFKLLFRYHNISALEIVFIDFAVSTFFVFDLRASRTGHTNRKTDRQRERHTNGRSVRTRVVIRPIKTAEMIT